MVHVDCFSIWKYCLLLHMALRDGDRYLLQEASLELQERLNSLGNHWAVQPAAYGICIWLYAKALIDKLQFHQNYTVFSGTLEGAVTKDWNANICFQLCLDTFDYAEDLLLLQNTIFDHSSLKRQQLELRYQPLVTIASELGSLYTHAIATLTVLCSQLPFDYLCDLYKRFHNLHRNLIEFSGKLAQLNISIKLIDLPELLISPSRNFAPSTVARSVSIPTAPAESEMEW